MRAMAGRAGRGRGARIDAARPPLAVAHGFVDFAPLLAAVCDAEAQALPRPAGMDFSVNAYPVAVEAGLAALLCLAMHELVRNALLHAFPAAQRGAVGVHLWPTSGGAPRAWILIADSGCGFADEPPRSAGSGLVLARQFVEKAGGSLLREEGAGTVWRIGLP